MSPSDVVARADQPQPPLILDVATNLNFAPGEVAKHCLKHANDVVRQGETIAESKTGLWRKRKVVSPVDGTVLVVDSGRVVIRPRPKLFELRALLSGMVSTITPGYGVTIETPGALIQGVWGSGKEGYGVLKMGVTEPDTAMSGDLIEVAHHGTILVCGASLNMDLLTRAQEMHVRGLIVGGVPAELSQHVRRQLLPVIATEGMGHIPMSSVIFDLLQANEGREAMMLALTPGRWQSDRPELVIPLPTSSSPDVPPKLGVPLTAGLRVRVRRAWGAVGTVHHVYHEPRAVESGVKYAGVDVQLEDGTLMFVPYVNLDVIGN